jgi:hypothetical protein
VTGQVRALVAAAALIALAACQEVALVPPPEETAPAVAVPEPVPPSSTAISDLSLDLENFYGRVEANLKVQDLLRTDGGGRDAPYDATTLADNFERIALFEEYANVNGRIVTRQTASRLHRWERPVLVEIEFGPRAPEAKANRDRVSIAAFTARMARVTGHPMQVVQSGGNFHVFVVNEDDRRLLGPRLREIIPSIDKSALDTVIDMPRSTYCLVFAWDPNDDGAYEKAVAIIRSEHPDLLRLSCIHEEMAQGMGLANDSPVARPSVFNDDEEYALLTGQDEKLLTILYDPRLRAGMGAAEAMPIVREIAAELVPGGGT